MKLQKIGLIVGLLGASGLAASCKDDDPCDPGQVVMYSLCYPAPASGGGGSGGAGPGAAGSTAEMAAGAPSEGLNTAFGTACVDTKTSSDCGGEAPLCADLTQLGQSVMCTQINCSPGEANEGVCPSAFTCFAFPGYPSLCTKK